MSPNLEQGSIISDNDDADAIVRVTSYHRRDFDQTVIRAEPGQHDHVRSSLFKIGSIPSAGNSSLGHLQCLPIEIISQIFLSLDVYSALRFSQANRRALEITASIPEARRLGEHAVECLWALFRTGLAPHTNVSILHSTLSVEYCALCGSFGDFFFLPTATRCCFHCLEAAPALQVVSLDALCRALKESGVSAA